MYDSKIIEVEWNSWLVCVALDAKIIRWFKFNFQYKPRSAWGRCCVTLSHATSRALLVSFFVFFFFSNRPRMIIFVEENLMTQTLSKQAWLSEMQACWYNDVIVGSSDYMGLALRMARQYKAEAEADMVLLTLKNYKSKKILWFIIFWK